MATRDVIVVGASAGGVVPLRRMAADLPHDLPASVFVVLHTTPGQPSALPQLLDRAGPLPAASAEDGQAIEHGRLYVAPPDLQLLVDPGRMRTVLGPTENRHRPSVDVLFRSAARAYGPRVVGVVLSGILDDGTAGLIAVKIRGGLAVVQDPAEAFCDGMPRSAMRYLDVDHVVPASSLGALLGRLARERVDLGKTPAPSREMVFETRTRIVSLDPTMQTERDEDRPGIQSVIACPDCGGVLRGIQEGDLLRFRCRTGHAYSPETMLEAGREGIDRALWEALKAVEERLALRRRLIRQARERRLDSLVRHFEEQAREAQGAVDSLRVLLLQKVGG